MNPPAFTLDQLALFDRCLFPDDLARDFFRIGGYNEEQTRFEFRSIRNKRGLSAVGLYQEYIQDEHFTSTLNAILCEFFAKLPQKV